jgi:hypothetical protein
MLCIMYVRRLTGPVYVPCKLKTKKNALCTEYFSEIVLILLGILYMDSYF